MPTDGVWYYTNPNAGTARAKKLDAKKRTKWDAMKDAMIRKRTPTKGHDDVR